MSAVLTAESTTTTSAFQRGCDIVRRLGAGVLVDQGKQLSEKDTELWRGLMNHCQLDAATAMATDCVLPRAVATLQRLSTEDTVPGDMLRIIHSTIEEITRTPVTNAACADMLLSLTMHVVAHANMPALRLKLAYVQAFATVDENGELEYSLFTMITVAEMLAVIGKEVPACPQVKKVAVAVAVPVESDDNDDIDIDDDRHRKRRYRRHKK